MRVIRTFALLVCAATWIVSSGKKGDDDGVCKKVKCDKGKSCEVMSDPEVGDMAICVVATDCSCTEGYECVRSGKSKTCVCVAGACLPQGEPCGGGAFHCSNYQECVDDARCCIGDCESNFAEYVFKRPEPICADDGVTYESLCYFDRDKCIRNAETFVSFVDEECLPRERMCGSHRCSADEICAKSHMGFRCCQATCPDDDKTELCGDDNHLHRNACYLKRTACIIGRDIQVLDDELCRKPCPLGKKDVKSGDEISLKDGCSVCRCNNGHWHCLHTACL